MIRINFSLRPDAMILLALAGLFIFSAPAAMAKTVQIAITDPASGNPLRANGNFLLADDSTIEDGIILITHGTLAHNRMEVIRTMQELLAERGFNSLAITLTLGIDNRKGMYDCAVPHNHQHQDAIYEIDAWVDWLKKQGVGPITLMGHSRGGNQTAWYASMHDSDAAIVRIVLLAPQIWSAQKQARDYEKRYKTPLAPILKRAQRLLQEGKGKTMLEDIGFIYCPDAKVSAASFASYYTPDSRMDTPSLLPLISKPVLVIAGSEDQVVKGLIDEMKAYTDRENVTFVTIDGADHFFLNFFAEDAADAIEAFMTK